MAYGRYFEIVIDHPGLHTHRVIRGTDQWIVEAKAAAQRRAWDEQYRRKLSVEHRRLARENKRQAFEENLREAVERTHEAQEEITELKRILRSTLATDDRIDWERLKQKGPFAKRPPEPKPYLPTDREPLPDDPPYIPLLNFFDKLVPSSSEKKHRQSAVHFALAHGEWERHATAVDKTNQQIYAENVASLEAWETEKAVFESAQRATNEAVENQRGRYENLDDDAIVQYCDLVLSQSQYPSLFPREFEIAYDSRSKVLIVEYALPPRDELPQLKEVKFVRSRNEFSQSFLPRKVVDEMYDDVLFQVCLRTIHELFGADLVRALQVVVFNGTVRAPDPGTGNISTTTVMTVWAGRDVFSTLSLHSVDPRRCFEALGGKTGGNLAELWSVKPLLSIDSVGSNFDRAEGVTPTSSEEWQALWHRVATSDEPQFLTVADLSRIIEFPVGEVLSAVESRRFAEAITARGLAVEPDAHFGGPPYRQREEVALFKPSGTWVGGAYLGAAALLKMTVSIAAADGEISENELEIARTLIEQDLSLSKEEQQRLRILEQLLCRDPALASRSLARFAKRLPSDKRRVVGETLAHVAMASGRITTPEWRALRKAFAALGLPPSALDETFRATGVEFQEVRIAQAQPPTPGERIPPIPDEGEAPPPLAFKLDTTRIAQIVRETNEVISILAAVMSDELEDSAVPGEVATADIPSGSPAWLDGLDPRYHQILKELLVRPIWKLDEFESLCARFNFMPLSVQDTLNEWADEHLGDFLLEGEDTITVRTNLVSADCVL